MKSFKDSNGRAWNIAITTDAIKRVRSLCGLDLLAIVEDGCKVLARLSEDLVTLVDVLYVVCRPEADAAGITDEQFGRALSGDSIQEGFDALTEAIADFFPAPRRTLLKSLIGKVREVGDQLHRAAGEAMEALRPEAIVSELRQKRSDFSGSSPALSASTPDP